MGYRTGLEIKKIILDQLANRPHVLSELERRVDTNDRVLRRHLEELEYLGVVRLTTPPRHARTGRPYTTVAINPYLNAIVKSYSTKVQPSQQAFPGVFPGRSPGTGEDP